MVRNKLIFSKHSIIIFSIYILAIVWIIAITDPHGYVHLLGAFISFVYLIVSIFVIITSVKYRSLYLLIIIAIIIMMIFLIIFQKEPII